MGSQKTYIFKLEKIICFGITQKTANKCGWVFAESSTIDVLQGPKHAFAALLNYNQRRIQNPIKHLGWSFLGR